MVIHSIIALSQLRPDVVLYFLCMKTVIILELTCPCEEKIKECHHTKDETNYLLSLTMVSKGLSVHLFPIEVDVRGYCSTNVKSCLINCENFNFLPRVMISQKFCLGTLIDPSNLFPSKLVCILNISIIYNPKNVILSKVKNSPFLPLVY